GGECHDDLRLARNYATFARARPSTTKFLPQRHRKETHRRPWEGNNGGPGMRGSICCKSGLWQFVRVLLRSRSRPSSSSSFVKLEGVENENEEEGRGRFFRTALMQQALVILSVHSVSAADQHPLSVPTTRSQNPTNHWSLKPLIRPE